jgi:hypothetical protein
MAEGMADRRAKDEPYADRREMRRPAGARRARPAAWRHSANVVSTEQAGSCDECAAAGAVEPLTRQAMAQRSTRATSGLVQQQRLFHSRRGAP